MGLTVKNNTKVAVEIESTEGTYVAPSAATSFVQTLSDGFEMTPSKELLERSVFNGSIGKTQPRTGTRSVSGSIPVEFKAAETEGSAPEADKLLRSALGTRRQIATEITTKASGNTASQLQIEDADIASLNVGDIIMTKAAGAYHVSPISAKVSTPGSASVTLLVPHPSGDHPDSVVIAKSTVYTVADSGHPSLSITKYLQDAIRQVGKGCRVTSLALENFTTGQLPTLNIGFEGLDYDETVNAPAYTPDYDGALPPIVLEAMVYQDGAAIDVNELSFSVENTLGFATATSAENGRISGRATERTVTGSINPYKADNSVSNYTKFKNNTSFSLFAYAKNDTNVDGEMKQVVAVYMPNCLPTELSESDQDGIVQENIAFSADRGPDGTQNEIYIAFI